MAGLRRGNAERFAIVGGKWEWNGDPDPDLLPLLVIKKIKNKVAPQVFFLIEDEAENWIMDTIISLIYDGHLAWLYLFLNPSHPSKYFTSKTCHKNVQCTIARDNTASLPSFLVVITRNGMVI